MKKIDSWKFQQMMRHQIARRKELIEAITDLQDSQGLPFNQQREPMRAFLKALFTSHREGLLSNTDACEIACEAMTYLTTDLVGLLLAVRLVEQTFQDYIEVEVGELVREQLAKAFVQHIGETI